MGNPPLCAMLHSSPCQQHLAMLVLCLDKKVLSNEEQYLWRHADTVGCTTVNVGMCIFQSVPGSGQDLLTSAALIPVRIPNSF